jgi:hypothetical protein
MWVGEAHNLEKQQVRQGCGEEGAVQSGPRRKQILAARAQYLDSLLVRHIRNSGRKHRLVFAEHSGTPAQSKKEGNQKACGSGFGALGLGNERACDLGLRVEGLGKKKHAVQGLGFRIQGMKKHAVQG